MWREYTREHPARPHLALWATIGLFAGTVGLAQYVASARAPAVLLRECTQYPESWPFAFTLPPGYGWFPKEEGVVTSPDGMAGQAPYETAVDHELTISFQLMAPGTTAAEAAGEKLADVLVDSRPVYLGPVKGEMTAILTPAGSMFVATGCLPCGLAIRTTYVTSVPHQRAAREFEAFCRSITFKDWWIEP
jgi:hypothetical protein